MATAANLLHPEPDVIRAYLAEAIGDHIHLVSILPDGDERGVKGQWFGDDADRAAQWAVLENQQGKGVYTTVNVCRDGLNKKPKGGKADPADMGDMVAHRFVHVDIDPPKDGSAWDTERALLDLAALRYPPSFVIHTGGGLGAFWRLDEAVIDKRTVTDTNRALAQRLGGDNCHNHDRLMRLPGTINWPNKVKSARGRQPALSSIVEPDDGVVYPLGALAAEYQPTADDPRSKEREHVDIGDVEFLTADDLKLGKLDALRRLIDQPKGRDRSGDAYACAGYMVRRGFDDAKILGVLLNPANRIHEHIGDQADPRRAAERCIEGTRGDLRRQAQGDAQAGKIGLQDFYAYMPMHNYIYVPSREPWPAASVNSRIAPVPIVDADGQPELDKNGEPVTIQAAAWLDQNRPVEQMTWAPGEPLHVADRLISDGGWIERKGASCFNLYRPPMISAGEAREARPWVDHVRRIYPAEADHIISWLAHRVQRPQEKVNHAIVFGGSQGIGKDTMLEPVKYAVGAWNFAEVSPQQMLGRFNGFVKSVILRVSEARDLGDVDRFAFYDHMKAYTAAPPDVLRVDEKNLREYAVFNVCGVIITSNHKTDGIYLPPDDRRHFVAWSEATRDSFAVDYWTSLYGWFAQGGNRHVAAYLGGLDLSRFDPKAPPPKTDAFWAVVNANRVPEDAELADALDALMRPKATTLRDITLNTSDEFAIWLNDRRNSRKVPHRLEECGYVPCRNPSAQDGLWKLGGKRVVIYVQRELSVRDGIAEAQRIVSLPGYGR